MCRVLRGWADHSSAKVSVEARRLHRVPAVRYRLLVCACGMDSSFTILQSGCIVCLLSEIVCTYLPAGWTPSEPLTVCLLSEIVLTYSPAGWIPLEPLTMDTVRAPYGGCTVCLLSDIVCMYSPAGWIPLEPLRARRLHCVSAVRYRLLVCACGKDSSIYLSSSLLLSSLDLSDTKVYGR